MQTGNLHYGRFDCRYVEVRVPVKVQSAYCRIHARSTWKRTYQERSAAIPARHCETAPKSVPRRSNNQLTGQRSGPSSLVTRYGDSATAPGFAIPIQPPWPTRPPPPSSPSSPPLHCSSSTTLVLQQLSRILPPSPSPFSKLRQTSANLGLQFVPPSALWGMSGGG